MSEVIDLTKTRTLEIKPSMTHDEMVSAYNAEIPIYGFHGGVEVDASTLSEPVPSEWPNSAESWEDEVHHKTFSEYCQYFPSKNAGKVLLKVGCVDANKNRPYPVDNNEFRLWADHFGIDNLKTKSEFQSLVNTDYPM